MIIAIEEYIEDNKISDLAKLQRRLRYEHPEWHMLISTKMTFYFSMFIQSYRNMLREGGSDIDEVVNDVRVNPDTGEVIEGSAEDAGDQI